ncbi:MAG TPA: DUF4919 domain-containing protein [Thermoanaerobaculia bacterium]|nr:DUF4919 domain-containing protein [Thermoanaerobaculia bacterium]
MRARRMLWLRLSAVAVVVAGALAPRAAYPGPAPASYESLLEKARRGDAGLDFTALRMAWADRLAKAARADSDLRNKMFDALHKDQWAVVIETGNKVLAQNYLDIDAHMFVAFAYEKTHDAERAAQHRTMGNGLMKSILASGNGRDFNTAFVVVSVDEEYAVLRHYRLASGKQDLVTAGGHSYDVLTAQTDAHEEATVYFNIDKVVAIEDAQLGGH